MPTPCLPLLALAALLRGAGAPPSAPAPHLPCAFSPSPGVTYDFAALGALRAVDPARPEWAYALDVCADLAPRDVSSLCNGAPAPAL